VFGIPLGIDLVSFGISVHLLLVFILELYLILSLAFLWGNLVLLPMWVNLVLVRLLGPVPCNPYMLWN